MMEMDFIIITFFSKSNSIFIVFIIHANSHMSGNPRLVHAFCPKNEI